MAEPNPPTWPSSVLVFTDTDNDISERIHTATNTLQTREGHFSNDRVALLFKPGSYNVDVLVGYYTQVSGLGNTPNDTVFTCNKGVYSPAMDPGKAGSLDNFWKSVENITQSNNMLWAVSQAAPLRRVEVMGDLLLHQDGLYASGGFLANVKVNRNIELGSQQQWMSRNSIFAQHPTGGAWSLVYSGCEGVPETTHRTQDADLAITTIDKTPVIAEKPFITCDEQGKFYLQVPKVVYDSTGCNMEVNDTDYDTIDFSSVYVARSDVDTYDSIQMKLDTGLNLLLTPGIYQLEGCLEISHHNQVVLGMGLATLVSQSGCCIKVNNNLLNVRIAGLMLQASKAPSDDTCLLQWGDPCINHQEVSVSGVISDVFCRVGGPDTDRTISVKTMMKIYSNLVIGDNIWLWRSDHASLESDESAIEGEHYHLVKHQEYHCDTGLEVYGNDVHMLGLAVEHTHQDLVVWKGERGCTIFFQAEFPYDVTQESYADKGHVAYRVCSEVKEHDAYGLGVYSYFRDYHVLIPTAISTAEVPGMRFVNPYVRYLNGKGGILSVMNGKGDAVTVDTERKLSFI